MADLITGGFGAGPVVTSGLGGGLTIAPGAPDAFVSLDQALSALAASLPADTSYLRNAIYEATSQIQRFLKRDIVQKSYVELYDSRGFSSLPLRQYPVNYVMRIAVSCQDVIRIANQDSVTNQRATVMLTASGDGDRGQLSTGVHLVRVASGVPLSVPPVTFAANPTVESLANTINALGYGWHAQALSPYALWQTTDIYPNQGAQNCLANGPNGGVATLQAFVQDVANYTVMNKSGEIRFNNQSSDPVFALMNIYSTPALTVFPSGWQNIRVEYNAGYSTVPYDIQQACLITVKDWLYQLQTDTRFDSETQDKWTYKLGDIMRKGLPQAARDILTSGGWRSFRRY